METRPIKGMRQRCGSPEADLFAAGDLCQRKRPCRERDDRRSAAQRVCPASVVRRVRFDVTRVVPQLEIYQYVQHLVSVVVGELAPGRSALDLPACRLSRRLRHLQRPRSARWKSSPELEPPPRRLLWIAGLSRLCGTLDMNILIRTITAGRGWWQIPVGGGIVAQSDPDAENTTKRGTKRPACAQHQHGNAAQRQATRRRRPPGADRNRQL